MRKLVVAAVVALLMVAASPVAAQEVIEITEADMDRFVELLRTNVANERADIVGASMEFTASESAAFWPLYTEYEKQLDEIGQLRWQLIKDYAASYDTMDDETAAALLERAFAVRDARTNYQREFVDRLMQAMGPKVAGRFMQVDNQIMNLLDLQIAQQLPLVKKPE